jgi:hypothetical protein
MVELAEKKIKLLSSETERKERDFQLKVESTKLQEWESLRKSIKKTRIEISTVTTVEESFTFYNSSCTSFHNSIKRGN